MKEGDIMPSKSLKFSIVLAVVLALFGGTAMADRRGSDNHHAVRGDRAYQHHHGNKWENHYRGRYQGNYYYAHRDFGHRNLHRPIYHQSRCQISKPHPLAPRIVFLGPIPVPVPPPPHEVLNYITGHR
jgi:hypothetical protein